MFHRSLSLALLSMMIISFCAAWVTGQDESKPPQNSMRKIRVKPSEISSKIGSGVKWEKDVESALLRSAETGKPVFWYVPTLRDSFMDRKPVIDRYMMAGPFSWETTRKMLNEHFVPVKATPSSEQQNAYELKPYKFVEPGFLVLDADGKQKLKVDRITTLHAKWFEALLASSLGAAVSNDRPSVSNPVTKKIQAQMQHAITTFHAGNHKQAAAIWKSIAEEHAVHPLGWKAAAEAEGFGPIVRGFEVQSEIPKAALSAGIKSAGSTAPLGVYEKSDVVKRSVAYLLGMQRQDGAWVDCDYDFGGTDSLPNVHVAVTSLAAMALLASKVDVPERAAEIESAIQRAASFVTDDANINKFDRDEILWAYAYRVRFLSRLVSKKPELKEVFQHCVETLEQIQTKRGTWYHEYANPFVTATALIALSEAKKEGAEITKSKIDQGVASLGNDRFGNGAFPYSSSRRQGGGKRAGTARQIAASAGRMPICELGLWNWQQSTDDNLVASIEISFDMHEHLASALKYDDHTTNMAYGGFFFWYDMRGRSEAISKVNDAAMRKKFESRQREIVMSLPEIDGCFVDSHELGRCYGTSMALLCLAMDQE